MLMPMTPEATQAHSEAMLEIERGDKLGGLLPESLTPEQRSNLIKAFHERLELKHQTAALAQLADIDNLATLLVEKANDKGQTYDAVRIPNYFSTLGYSSLAEVQQLAALIEYATGHKGDRGWNSDILAMDDIWEKILVNVLPKFP